MADVAKAKTDQNDDEVLQEKEGPREDLDFTPSHGITSDEAAQLLAKWGRNELEEKTTPKWLIYLQMYWGPMPVVIWIAIIIEAALQNWVDFGILMAIQILNATLGWYETTKAGDAVAALKASLKPKATVKRDGKFQTMDAALLVPGDCVLLASGSAVPADCLVNEGQIDVDQAALTGESLPVTMFRGDSCKMGSTVVRGEVEGTVEFTGKDTFFGKTAAMLQQGNELGNLQKILLKIMIILVSISLVLVVTAFGYMWAGLQQYKDEQIAAGLPYEEEHAPWLQSLEFAVVVLVASVPVAIEIVCTATLALGSRQLSAMGAIVARLVAIEEMAGMNMLCSDKTGTLTLNKMVIQEDTPTYIPGETQASVLLWAALAAKWKDPPRDALDTLVLGQVDLAECDKYEQLEFIPFDPTTKRTEGTLKGPDGKVFKTSKGAPHIMLKLLDPEHRDAVEKAVEWKVTELGKRGIRCLAVAKTDDAGKWQMVGILTFLDPPRPDTKDTIERAMAYGVDVKMITGDHAVIAKETSRQLGLGTNIPGAEDLPSMGADGKVPKDLGEKYGELILNADGFAQVYPEHKFLIVEALRQVGFAVGMTGDGVNDAPALKRADVGIAVQGATDAARAAADIVLTQPGLSVVVEAIVIARCIFQRVQSFINYRVACTLQLCTFFFIATFAFRPADYQPNVPGMVGFNPDAPKAASPTFNQEPGTTEQIVWPQFFTLPVLFLMLITVLNDGTLITIAYDHVNPSPRPEKWNLRILFIISIVLGIVACGSSLLLLWSCLDGWKVGSTMDYFGLPPPEYGQIVTIIYLKVSLSDFLTLFSARTNSFFFTMRPGLPLFCGFIAAVGVSTILASLWPVGNIDNIPVEGLTLGEYKYWPAWVWIYCIVFWLLQDACKVITYKILFSYNVFGIDTSKLVNQRGSLSVEGTGKQAELARQSVGMVENKLLGMKVDNAAAAVERASQKTGDVNLNRVSVSLGVARQSVNAARQSITQKGDIEGGVSEIKEIVKEMSAAADSVDPASKKEIAEKVEEVKAAAKKLEQSTAALKTTP